MTRLWTTLLTTALIGAGTLRADDLKEKDERPDGPGTRARIGRLLESPTWIGAMCSPADPALRAQLGLKADQGLVVLDVVPDSPAAKAGLQKYDVIASIGDKELNSVIDLMDAVRSAGEKELKLDIFRSGKKQSLAVTPDQRPDMRRAFQPAPVPPSPFGDDGLKRLKEHLEKMRDTLPEAEVRRLEQWIEQLEKGENRPLRMNVFGPGVVMHRAQAGGALPGGVSVVIKKQGDGPMQIHVERGEEKWDITEKEIDKLPKDLQEPVRAMVSGGGGAVFTAPNGAGGVVFGSSSGGDGKAQIQVQTNEQGSQTIVAPEANRKPLDAEVEQLRREIEQLRKQVEELKKPKAKEKA